MSTQKKCPDCGSLEIVEDSHYTQNQLVCADCGFILTEGLLTTTYADEEHLQGESKNKVELKLLGLFWIPVIYIDKNIPCGLL